MLFPCNKYCFFKKHLKQRVTFEISCLKNYLYASNVPFSLDISMFSLYLKVFAMHADL